MSQRPVVAVMVGIALWQINSIRSAPPRTVFGLRLYDACSTVISPNMTNNSGLHHVLK